jgi:hypothetical protein
MKVSKGLKIALIYDDPNLQAGIRQAPGGSGASEQFQS